MLKIKDNVDLKELEKFGLEEDKWKNALYYRHKDGISVDKLSREILVFFDNALPILYDLIKADLVEKVEA